jgi:hypothetical protein
MLDRPGAQPVPCPPHASRPPRPTLTDQMPTDARDAVRALALQARTRELALYPGAGISMCGPDPLPSGRKIGRDVARRVGPNLGLTDEQVDTVSLEELGELAAARGPGAVDLLRQTAAAAARFEAVLPNDGHRAIALLLCESAAIGMTVNWDRGANADPPWTAFGGTSAAAPLWAALTATIDSTSACAGHPVGFMNPALYRLAANSPADFNDITVGDNDVTATNNGAYPAGTGYDMTTGLGTPVGAPLATGLCNSTPPPDPTPPPPPATPPPTPPSAPPPTPPTTPAPSGSTSSTATKPPLPHATRATQVSLGRLPHGGLAVTPGGLLRLPLACPAVLNGCRASITLSLPPSHTHPHGITLATLNGRRLTPGAHATITLHLSHTRLAALERRHPQRVKLRLRITSAFAGGIRTTRTVTVVVRLPSKRR